MKRSTGSRTAECGSVEAEQSIHAMVSSCPRSIDCTILSNRSAMNPEVEHTLVRGLVLPLSIVADDHKSVLPHGGDTLLGGRVGQRVRIGESLSWVHVHGASSVWSMCWRSAYAQDSKDDPAIRHEQPGRIDLQLAITSSA